MGGSSAAYRSVSPQHPDKHRPQRPVLFAADKQLGEGAALGIARTRRSAGTLKVGQHKDVEQLGAESRAERVKTVPQLLLNLILSRHQPLMSRFGQ